MAKKPENVVVKEIAGCVDGNGQVTIIRDGKAVKVWPVDAKDLLNKDVGYEVSKADTVAAVVKPEPKATPKAAVKKEK